MNAQSYIGQARLKNYLFITTIVDAVKKILQDPNNSFYFPKVLKRTDHSHRSMEGWLPDIFPGTVSFNGESIKATGRINSVFMPFHINIPIDYKAWQALTIPGCQEYIDEPNLPRQATFEAVAKHWTKVANLYKAGLLDKFICEESKMTLPLFIEGE